MPIYAYRCEECGFAKDVLQKMSDEPLSVCLSCGKPSFKKQVTAAGFQLKGSGWYVTDFRDAKGAAPAATGGAVAATAESSSSSDAVASSSAASSATTAAPAASTAPAASAPATTGSENKAA
ncbi:FmdB family zinc ribbon protein [Undibacterium parvum]|uniref:Zinc ribbon domain-containing protein n=1 Tax=Undibacterium parvum TaxID=401471 RepID=A0A3Q9BRE1_9BURK|nr:FmdB family zinc ribbon protein [Undibacterium parvum]AZP12774.1 zinc ribbon domain-containing protein [Undibacterium parvum]